MFAGGRKPPCHCQSEPSNIEIAPVSCANSRPNHATKKTEDSYAVSRSNSILLRRALNA